MNYLLSILLVCLAGITQAQYPDSAETDSLVKYSYNISGSFRSTPNSRMITNYSATGFFISPDDKIFFVTAGHVLSGCKEKAQIKKSYPDKMNISLNNADGTLSQKILPIDLTSYRDTGVCPAAKYPDIGTYQLPDSVRSRVFSIDTLLQTDLSSISGPVKIFGYPIGNSTIQPGRKTRESSSLQIDRYQLLDSFHFINTEGELDVDSTNYILKPAGVTIDYSLQGYSGSPVFEFTDNNWRFIGLLMGANIPGKYLVIVKPRYLAQKIKQDAL